MTRVTLARSALLISLAAPLAILAASSAGTGCAGAVTPDSQLDPTPLMDASADAEMDAPADAPPAYNGVIGRACAADADCGDGYRCQTTVPNGYCVMDCVQDAPCPQGTLCSPVPFSRIAGVCMVACASQAECRPGYACDVVYLFQGDPGSPKSPGPVCWEPAKDAGP